MRLILPLVAALLLLITPAMATPQQKFDKGVEAYYRGDYVEAVNLFLKAAALGFAQAQYNLGFMYYKGIGVPQDYAEALKWFRLAAEQGDATSQSLIGMMYEDGNGVPKDYAEAVKWYKLAAEQGNAIAQFGLGRMHFTGQSLSKDYVQAHMWLNLAGAQDRRAAKIRDMVATRMTPAQIAEAQRLAREWLAAHPR